MKYIKSKKIVKISGVRKSKIIWEDFLFFNHKQKIP